MNIVRIFSLFAYALALLPLGMSWDFLLSLSALDDYSTVDQALIQQAAFCVLLTTVFAFLVYKYSGPVAAQFRTRIRTIHTDQAVNGEDIPSAPWLMVLPVAVLLLIGCALAGSVLALFIPEIITVPVSAVLGYPVEKTPLWLNTEQTLQSVIPSYSLVRDGVAYPLQPWFTAAVTATAAYLLLLAALSVYSTLERQNSIQAVSHRTASRKPESFFSGWVSTLRMPLYPTAVPVLLLWLLASDGAFRNDAFLQTIAVTQGTEHLLSDHDNTQDMEPEQQTIADDSVLNEDSEPEAETETPAEDSSRNTLTNIQPEAAPVNDRASEQAAGTTNPASQERVANKYLLTFSDGTRKKDVRLYKNRRELRVLNKVTGEEFFEPEFFSDNEKKWYGIEFSDGEQLTPKDIEALVLRPVYERTVSISDGYNPIKDHDYFELYKAYVHPVRRIFMRQDIQPSDVYLKREEYELVIYFHNEVTEITAMRFFIGESYLLHDIEFYDGTVWDVDYIRKAVIKPTDQRDDITGYATNDVLRGLGGDDYIDGQSGDDVLYGDEGDDQLFGRGGNDILHGGPGTDRMNGGGGSDVYLVGPGDGLNIISNHDETPGRYDVLRFMEGISPASVSIKQNNKSLIIELDGVEIVRVGSFLEGRSTEIDAIEFYDGTKWDLNHIKKEMLKGTDKKDVIRGTYSDDQIDGLAGDDVIWGEAGNDTLLGGPGSDTLWGRLGNDVLNGGPDNDTLKGDEGNDILRGGPGKDYLEGDEGNDVYLVGPGDGITKINNHDRGPGRYDVLRFIDGISPSMVTLKRNKSNLIIDLSGGEQVVVENHFTDSRYLLNAIGFEDGTVWTADYIEQELRKASDQNDQLFGSEKDDRFDGLAGDDYINGGKGDDILDGGSGNDTLEGDDGNDTLFGGPGDDQLSGGDGDDILRGGPGADTLIGERGNDVYLIGSGDELTVIKQSDSRYGQRDVIRFMENILPESVSMVRNDNNLIVKVKNSEQVVVEKYFSSHNYAVSAIEFHDGTLWELDYENMKKTTPNEFRRMPNAYKWSSGD